MHVTNEEHSHCGCGCGGHDHEHSHEHAHCYGVGGNRDYLQMLSSCTFAPGQSRMCRLDYSLVPEEITFDIEYLSGNKTYSDHFNVNIKAGASMLTTKVCTSGKELQTISYTLQELLQKLL